MYLAGWLDPQGWDRLVALVCDREGIARVQLPDGLRIRDTATHRFVFNYSPEVIRWDGQEIPAAGVVWKPI